MRSVFARCALAAFAIAALAGCGGERRSEDEIRLYPMDTTEGIVTRDGIAIDPTIKVTGTSSLKITAADSVTVHLYDTGDIDIENARLVYRARLRTENAAGPVYLEMWCRFAGGREYFSRGVERPRTGTNEWTTVEIPFFLKAGENPDNVRLNLVIAGAGTVWIDDVRLIRAPL
jgi:hypothetical protein